VGGRGIRGRKSKKEVGKGGRGRKTKEVGKGGRGRKTKEVGKVD
jgi:hypothetical protein